MDTFDFLPLFQWRYATSPPSSRTIVSTVLTSFSQFLDFGTQSGATLSFTFAFSSVVFVSSVSAARDLLRRFGSGLFADAAFGGRPTDLRFLEGFSGRPPISLKYSSRSSCAPSLRECQ